MENMDNNTTTSEKKWGGARIGAGRKGYQDAEIRKPHSIYCSHDELRYIKRFLQVFRKLNDEDEVNRYDCTIYDLIVKEKFEKFI